MTVAYRSTATATNTPGTNALSVTVSRPAGTVDGDLLVAVTHGWTGDTFTPPAGWTLLQQIDDGTGLRSRAFIRVADSEPSSYLWTFDTVGVGGTIGVSVTAFSGAGGLDSWHASYTTSADPSAGVPVTPARDALAYHVYCWRDTTSDTVGWSTFTPGTETHDVAANDAGASWRGQSGWHPDDLTEGGQSTPDVSADPTNSVTYGIHWTFAVADAVPAGEDWATDGFGIELELGGTWTDVTDHVLYEKGLDVTRGTSSEGGRVTPSTLNAKFRNDDARFSANVPEGVYFDDLNLGTKARTWLALGDVAMFTEGQTGDRFRCPQTEAIRLRGDVDIRADVEPKTWRQEQVLAAQAYVFNSSLGKWVFYIDVAGYPHFAWGDSILTADVASTVQVPPAARKSVRVTVDIDNGAGGHTVTFYTSDSVTGTWTQLGQAVTRSGTAVIGGDLIAIPLTVGATESGRVAGRAYFPDYAPFSGRIYEVMVKSGIDGTTVANPVFTGQDSGARSFTDAQGNLWTAMGSAICSNRWYRFHGELSSSPPVADSTGTYRAVDAVFSGPLRRSQQNTRPLESPLRRYYTSEAGIYAPAVGAGLEGPFYPCGYWPLEDVKGSQQVAPGFSGLRPGVVTGSPVFGQFGDFPASKPIMQLKTGSRIWLGLPPPWEVTIGAFSVEFLLAAPDGILNGADLLEIRTTGTAPRIRLSYPSTNQLQLTSYGLDSSYNLIQIDTTGAVSVPVYQRLLHVAIVADGSSVELYTREPADTSWTIRTTGNLTTTNLGTINSVVLNPEGAAYDVYMGHVAVFDGTRMPTGATYRIGPGLPRMYPGNAFLGESAGDRAERLAGEQGFPFFALGGHAANIHPAVFSTGENGTQMGGQGDQSFVGLLEQCADSDMGMVVEPREFFGIGYRTRQSLYNQPAVLTLDYANGELSGELRPEFDDLSVRNLVTVARDGGSESTYEETDGRRGSGVIGEYPDSVTLSLQSDAQTGHAAAWSVHLGTVNEYRFPSIEVAMENARAGTNPELVLGLLRLDIGSRIVVENPPEWLPPEDIDQIVVGYRERRDQFQHSFTVYTVPAAPYRVGVVEGAQQKARANTSGSTLGAALDTVESSLSVVTRSGSARWVDSATYPDDFPFDITAGGERMTVTAVTGTSNTQTFTVTRSVNGVVKSHRAGESVSLAEPTHTAW
ncbi:hypothetical protein ABT348_24105 [Streptomyces olivaceus]|uniref:hypothetical protein n=1 Tax=Streptomyces olivaceus TaxID=47716 RepID=UPI00332F02ED